MVAHSSWFRCGMPTCDSEKLNAMPVSPTLQNVSFDAMPRMPDEAPKPSSEPFPPITASTYGPDVGSTSTKRTLIFA